MMGLGVSRYDWKIGHSFTVDELKFEDELSLLITGKIRLYDGGGNYVDLGYQRAGSDLSRRPSLGLLILPEMMIMHRDRAYVDDVEYTDVKRSVVWKKGLGVKTRIAGDGVDVYGEIRDFGAALGVKIGPRELFPGAQTIVGFGNGGLSLFLSAGGTVAIDVQRELSGPRSEGSPSGE